MPAGLYCIVALVGPNARALPMRLLKGIQYLFMVPDICLVSSSNVVVVYSSSSSSSSSRTDPWVHWQQNAGHNISVMM